MTDMKKCFFMLLTVILFQSSDVFSQQVTFNRVIFKPEKTIGGFSGITQDQLGYIWLSANGGGLYRFDGSEFINYSHDSNSNTIASDKANTVFADSSNMIWIGTFGAGLDRFDLSANSFEHFRHDSKIRTSIANDTVTTIFEDRSGNLWVGSFGGLDLFDRKLKTFIHYQHQADDSSSLSSNEVSVIYEDRRGTIWVGTGAPPLSQTINLNTGGLNRFERATGKFTRFMHDPSNPNSITGNKIEALFEDSKGNFWVGSSGDGLQILDRETGIFTHYYYDPSHPEHISRPALFKKAVDYITFINEDVKGGIWAGSIFSGINRYDTTSKKTTHFGLVVNDSRNAIAKWDTTAGYDDFSSLHSLFTKDGIVWITTLSSFAGNFLYKANLFKKTVPYFLTAKYNGANSFYSSGDSILWIGTDSGLVRRNLRSQAEKHYIPEPGNPNSLSHIGINALRIDKENNIWLATEKGLNKFNPSTNVFTRYISDKQVNASLNNDTCLSLCVDHNNNVWVGTSKNGLDKLDEHSGTFKHYLLLSTRKIPSSMVYCIREGHDNEMWVGSDEGLYRIDIRSGLVKTILKNAIVKTICIDAKNILWIGADTSRGGSVSDLKLYRHDLKSSQFIAFTDSNTRTHIYNVLDIMQDDKEDLWVSTTDNIIEINQNGNVVRKLGAADGVHRNGFVFGDNFKDRTGRMFFGDDKGYYSFSPDELNSHFQPRLNFTGFRINGRKIIQDGDILKAPIWKSKELDLAFNQNSFSFEFAGLNFGNPGDVNYLVMLENYDDDWRENKADNRAFYFNIPPGKYAFHVKAYNTDGGFSEKSIEIIISPPWWKTWWAYAIIAFLCAASVWGFISYRSRKLRRENRILEERVIHRTNQLNQSLEDLKATQNQLVQSEKMASLGELTAGIAHEIQNPLNFVNNFSEVNAELITEMKEEISRGNMEGVKLLANDIGENEAKIMHHGKRADAIVKGMLQHSRSSSGQKEPTDLNALADEYLRLSYHGLRAKDKFINATMQTDFDPMVGKVNIIPQDIGRALLNLYNNAFYAVSEKKKEQPEGFEPTLFVGTKRIGNMVEIRVRDNGRGIPGKVRDKIFQPFFTTKPTGMGTGLGLSLSYETIKAHSGELMVQSKEGEGAEFMIRIPVA